MGVLVISSLLFATVVATRGASFSQPPNANPLSVTCEVQDGNYCRALCNDVVLDISNVLTYPVVVTSDDYSYVYSPCDGVYCTTDEPTNVAMCQVTTDKATNFTCGRIDSVAWILERTDPYRFYVHYGNGTEMRNTIVTFNEDPTMTKSVLVFTGEDPTATYNLAVRGNNVGQPSDQKCTVDPSNSCVATCAGQKFDISKVFSYPAKTLGGEYTYSYSPCGGATCGGDSDTSALCQSNSNFSYSLGSINSVEWWLNSSSPIYVFTIEYKQGADGRLAKVKFVEDNKMLSSTFVFTAEPKPLEYEFEVRGSDVGQPITPGRGCSANSTNPCVLNCNGSEVVDISNVFKYPTSAENDMYRFVYNPCSRPEAKECGCPSPQSGNAVCQFEKKDQPFGYGCGKVSDVQWTVKRTNPYIFSITYYGGDTIRCDGNDEEGVRSSEVTFYEDTSLFEPTFKFLNESSDWKYSFEVRASNVGQKMNKTSCVVDPRTPCRAICNKTITIDLSTIFSNPITIVGPNNNFIFSPCVGYTCGSPAKNSSVCLSDQYSLGQVNTVQWTLSQIKPFFIFTCTYMGGDNDEVTQSNRSSTVTFIENPEVNRIVAVYAGPLSQSSYLFDVVGSCVGQPNCTGLVNSKLFTGFSVHFVFVWVGVLLLAVAAAVVLTVLAGKWQMSQRKEVPLLK